MTRELEPLPLTGERTVPGVPEENYWFRRHEIAYLALLEHCAGARVLEAGCGEGYGAKVIADVADRVIALDYDELTSAHVAKAYPEVDVLRGNLARLPLGSSTVDVVVNFQVIEHLWDQPGFLRECLRVLRPGGRLLISTPNRITFSPGRDTPLNPFHTRELAPSELDSLLTVAGFVTEQLLGLHHGPRLRSVEAAYQGSIIDAQVRVVLGDGVWPPDLLRDIGSITASDFVLSAEDLDASLDLVAVAVRP
ncbi:class I SAM-dependent methyltransferase [Allokutzneria sp. A3M-2-11 16]|uniref:class I SAM-dependent methyltransferase n=1 Tax=Allokutzneria sp. A3M-2-11 16 TaxID=2962043 RepID=UPI0020B80488|nr:class I SAM-dependent methyltransferase [Allokutzneria sp. A3M-2-11 16]MCP3798134.1 class I SAM-dependent methyltransferase [Allokutzneria sp. A3M-2-11 16]